MCTHIRIKYDWGVSVWPRSGGVGGGTLLIHWMTLIQESPSAEGFHSEITGKSPLLTWTESHTFQTFPAGSGTEPSVPSWHYESQSVLWLLVCWHYSFGSMKSSSGSDTRSPQWAFHGVQPPHSPSLLVLVRGTLGPSEESLIKMKYICLFICISDKPAILLYQQSLPICCDHLKM